MKQEIKKVSIITPVYGDNTVEFSKTFESLIKQNNKDFEWIVVQDGELNSSLVNGDSKIPQLKLVGLNKNYGPSVARNVGFQVSVGDIIAYLDIGDEISENRIEHLIGMYKKFDIHILVEGYNIVDKGRMIFYNPLALQQSLEESGRSLQTEIANQNIAIPLGLSHIRLPFVLAGGFQPGITCGEDGILLRRMIKFTPTEKVMFSDHNAGTYYVNPVGQSRTQRRYDMGGFSFDSKDELGSHGQYLDEFWFKNYNSNPYYER